MGKLVLVILCLVVVSLACATTKTVIVEVTATPSLEEYTSEITALLSRYSEAFAALIDLGSSPRYNDTLTDYSDTWKSEITVPLAEILAIGAGIRNLQPPPKLQDVHNLIVKATRHYDESVSLFAEGVDGYGLGSDAISRAGDEMILGGKLINEASEELSTLLEDK